MALSKKVGVLFIVLITILLLLFLILRVSFTGNVVFEALADESVFNVKDYGAMGDGVTDDTDAIYDAMHAARIYLLDNDFATVYFPEGNYSVMPRGSVSATLYRKSNGLWESLGSFNGSGLSSIDGWLMGDFAPNSSFGIDDERYINRRNGRTYVMSSSVWVEEERLVDKIGKREWNENGTFLEVNFSNGWGAAYIPPRETDGLDDYYYVEFVVNLANSNTIFLLNQSDNGLTIQGDGPKKSVLRQRVWGDVDPMDYNVSSYVYIDSSGNRKTAKIVHSTRIPPKNNVGRYSRGHMFGFRGTTATRSIPFRDIRFKDLGLSGGTLANGNHAWYSGYDDLYGWDIQNKGIYFPGGGFSAYNLSVVNCELEGFRGEVLYRGGGVQDMYILVKDVEIHNSNSNLISITGHNTIINTTFYDAPGATENLAMGPQYTRIYNSTFDMNRNFPDRRMQWAAIYFGGPEAHFIAENNTFINTGFAPIFLSEWAHNVTVVNNVFIDNARAMYHIFLCQYCNSNNPWEPTYHGLNDINFSYNTIIGENRSVNGFLYYGGRGGWNGTSHNWTFSHNTLIGKNGKRIQGLVALQNHGPIENMQNFVVSDNIVTNGKLYYRNTGDVSRIVRPLYYNNTFTVANDPGAIDYINDNSASYYFYPFSPNVTFNVLKNNALGTFPVDFPVAIGGIDNYPVGFEIMLQVRGDSANQGIVFKPSSWNSFNREYLLVDDAAIVLKKGENGLFNLVSYIPRTEEEYIITQNSPWINARTRPTESFLRIFGHHTLNLTPSKPILFDDFSGIVDGDVITLNYNEHTGFANNNRIVTGTGRDWTTNVSGSMIAQKLNGILQLHIVSDDSTCGNGVLEGYERCDFGASNDGVSASSQKEFFAPLTDSDERLYYCNSYCFSSYELVPLSEGNSDLLTMNTNIHDNQQIFSQRLFFPFHANFSSYVSTVSYSVAGMTDSRDLLLTNNSFNGYLRVPFYGEHVLRFYLTNDNGDSRTILVPVTVLKNQFSSGSRFYGNLSTITSDSCLINMTIANEIANFSADYADVKTIGLYCNDELQMFFDWNFSNNRRMDLQELGLLKGYTSKRYTLSRGLSHIVPYSKSVILDLDVSDSRDLALCFADKMVNDVFDLSSGCNESGEHYVLLSDLPTVVSNYSLSYFNDNVSRVIISGLNHSVVLQTCVEQWACLASGWVDLNQCGSIHTKPSEQCVATTRDDDNGGGGGGNNDGFSSSRGTAGSSSEVLENTTFVQKILDVLSSSDPQNVSNNSGNETNTAAQESYFSSWLFILIVFCINVVLIVIILINLKG